MIKTNISENKYLYYNRLTTSELKNLITSDFLQKILLLIQMNYMQSFKYQKNEKVRGYEEKSVNKILL